MSRKKKKKTPSNVLADKLHKMFAIMPTGSRMMVFSHGLGFGIAISFIEKDFGFGEMTFYVDKITGQVSFDNEEMKLEHCAEILMRAVGTVVLPPKSAEPKEPDPAEPTD